MHCMVLGYAYFVRATAMVHRPLHTDTVCTRVECSSHFLLRCDFKSLEHALTVCEIAIFSFCCTGIASKAAALLNLPRRNLCNMRSLTVLTYVLTCMYRHSHLNLTLLPTGCQGSIDQSINQPINQSIHRSINQGFNSRWAS